MRCVHVCFEVSVCIYTCICKVRAYVRPFIVCACGSVSMCVMCVCIR